VYGVPKGFRNKDLWISKRFAYLLDFSSRHNRGVDFYFEFISSRHNRGVDFYFEFLPAKSMPRVGFSAFFCVVTKARFKRSVLTTFVGDLADLMVEGIFSCVVCWGFMVLVSNL
jgi:hypothetical protein